MSSGLAAFLWTLRRKWKGFAIFLALTAVMIFCVTNLYPEIEQLRGEAIAKAFEGDIKVSLVQDDEGRGDYTLTWSEFAGATGYVVVESQTELPLSLITDLDMPEVDLRLLETFSSLGDVETYIVDATATEIRLTDLNRKYGEENALVHFGVLAFEGERSGASIVGASHTVNTRNMVAEGALDAFINHPLIKPFVGDARFDFYTIKGFLCVELFTGLVVYLIIYFLIQYAGEFSSEMENKTVDLLLSTPLTRRGLFLSRYLAWATINFVFILSWILMIYLGIIWVECGDDASLADVARTMLTFFPYIQVVQGLCMLASVLTNQTMRAYAISFGIYFAMAILEGLAIVSERLNGLKYMSITYYWKYDIIFIDGVVPWGDVLVLSAVAVVLLFAGLWVFDRKDLAS